MAKFAWMLEWCVVIVVVHAVPTSSNEHGKRKPALSVLTSGEAINTPRHSTDETSRLASDTGFSASFLHTALPRLLSARDQISSTVMVPSIDILAAESMLLVR